MHKYTWAMRQNLHIIHPLLKTLRFHGCQMQRERMVPQFVGLTTCWLCLILPIELISMIYEYLWYSHSIAPCFFVWLQDLIQVQDLHQPCLSLDVLGLPGGATVRRWWTDDFLVAKIGSSSTQPCVFKFLIGSLLPRLGLSFLFFENTEPWHFIETKIGKTWSMPWLSHIQVAKIDASRSAQARCTQSRSPQAWRSQAWRPQAWRPQAWRAQARGIHRWQGHWHNLMPRKNMSDDLDFRWSTNGLTVVVEDWSAMKPLYLQQGAHDHSFQIRCSPTQYLRGVCLLLMLRGGKIQFQHNRQNLFDCMRIHCAHALFFILGPWSCSATLAGTNNLWSKRLLQFLAGLQQL